MPAICSENCMNKSNKFHKSSQERMQNESAERKIFAVPVRSSPIAFLFWPNCSNYQCGVTNESKWNLPLQGKKCSTKVLEPRFAVVLSRRQTVLPVLPLSTVDLIERIWHSLLLKPAEIVAEITSSSTPIAELSEEEELFGQERLFTTEASFS